MSFNKEQFEELIRETLDEHGLGGDSAVNLLLGTAAVESAFGTYLKQIRGPALGVFQMEPATFNWLHNKNKKRLWEKGWLSPIAEELVTNLELAIVFARLRYLADPEPLPAAENILGLAGYWKRIYNTHLGAGTVADFLRTWEEYVEKPPNV